jgi:hypothetical protein
MGLPERTTRRTLPHMFGRNRTQPDHEPLAAVEPFRSPLTGFQLSRRTEPVQFDGRDLRRRLGRSSTPGLRARLDRPLRTA